MKELTAEWVSKADNDLEVARLARYPGVSVTLEMADEALEAASRVRDFIQTRLRSTTAGRRSKQKNSGRVIIDSPV